MTPKAKRRFAPLPGELAFKPVFASRALPHVLRASWRASKYSRARLDRVVAELRRASLFTSPFLRRPTYLAAVVERLLPMVPPWGHGRCLKRSLLLLDLWSRCGLEPTLHLGVTKASEGIGLTEIGRRPLEKGFRFHAWITTPEGGPLTDDEGHVEIWRG